MLDINEDLTIQELQSIKELDGFIDGPYKLKYHQKIYCSLKSIIDFLIALIAIISLSPALIIISIAIKIDSKGPIIFKQKRIGKNNKDFYCFKFRSMFVEARADIAGYEYNDVNKYITKVGRFIRKTSLDELPQLFNVLNGTMSIIGYRPSQRTETILTESREKYCVYQVKPGISGWAQINGRDILAAQPKKKAKYDAYYVQHYSLWMDVKIFFLSIIKVLKRSGIKDGEVK